MTSYETMLQNLRVQHGLLTDITFMLPPNKIDCSCMNHNLSILNSSGVICSNCGGAGYTETLNLNVVAGTILDISPDSLKYDDLNLGSEYGQFDGELYSIHLSKSLCVLDSGEFLGQYCYDISKRVIVDNEEFVVVGKKETKLLSQARLLVRRKN